MNASTSTHVEKKLKVTKEVTQITKNIVLEGTHNLRAERFTTTYKVVREIPSKPTQSISIVSKKIIDEKVEPLCFHLVEVTPEMLADYRKKGISSFVLKVDGKLYYSEIPNNISFVSSNILGTHKCALAGHECRRLSAASDEKGGCQKVRNCSNHIERYPWITAGYETFNTSHDSFVVVKCLHYEKCPPRKIYSSAEVSALKLGLAQFVWDDVDSLAAVRSRKQKARAKAKNLEYIMKG